MPFPRMVLAGASSGSGKTTLSIALMAAYARRGVRVQPFKVGPDFIDPAFHAAVTGRPGRNLDPWLVPEKELGRMVRRHAPENGLSIIEGVMGLYDGLGSGAFAGTAHVASLLAAPVVLVVNAEGLSLSAAALVAGYADFRPVDAGADLSGLRLGGVILNRVSGERHYELLRNAIERHTGVPCFGFLPKGLPSLPHRHLGLVPAEEQRGLPAFVAALETAAERHIDLPGLLRLAESAPCPKGWTDAAEDIVANDAPPRNQEPARNPDDAPGNCPRIGVARDAAFSFYYQDNLECLEECGAQPVFFSPLADASLPEDLDGLYLGGGFPEEHAGRLEANEALRCAVRRALEDGMPAYAECGGMLYLCDALVDREGRERAMAGFFPARGVMTPRLQPFGYVTVTLERDCCLGPAGSRFQAHEFHYSRLEEAPPPLARSEKADGRAWTSGMLKKNTVAWYAHLHFRGCSHAAQSFVNACRAFHARRAAMP